MRITSAWKGQRCHLSRDMWSHQGKMRLHREEQGTNCIIYLGIQYDNQGGNFVHSLIHIFMKSHHLLYVMLC